MREEKFPTAKEIKKATDGLVSTTVEGDPERQEAWALLAQISRARGRPGPRYFSIGPRDNETGRELVESGAINVEGEKVPDKK